MTDKAEQLLRQAWEWNPLVAGISAAVLALAAVGLLVSVLRAIGGIVRAARGSTRGASSNVKLMAGQAVVQAGMTWAVVTGTYEFCTKVFKLPEWESIAFAVFLEAATWVTVGMIFEHGKGTDDKGKQNTGFGPAGPFFYLFSVLGGVLAVIAGATFGAMIGRTVIVVFGTCLWYLTLLRFTRRAEGKTKFRWTPRRLFIAIGALEPEDQDVENEHQEWQVRRLARAMRRANGRWPWSWLGQRALVTRGEQTTEDVIVAARRRYAVTHLLVSTVRPDSEVMARVIETVKAEAYGRRNDDVEEPAEQPTGTLATESTTTRPEQSAAVEPASDWLPLPIVPAQPTRNVAADREPAERRALSEMELGIERRALLGREAVIGQSTSGTPDRALTIGHAPDRAVTVGLSPSGTNGRALPDAASGTTVRAAAVNGSGIGQRTTVRVPEARRAPVEPSGTTTERALPDTPNDVDQMTDAQKRDAARAMIRAKLEAGQPVTGAQVAREYGKTDPKWGSRLVKEIRDQLYPVAGSNQEDQER